MLHTHMYMYINYIHIQREREREREKRIIPTWVLIYPTIVSGFHTLGFRPEPLRAQVDSVEDCEELCNARPGCDSFVHAEEEKQHEPSAASPRELQSILWV